MSLSVSSLGNKATASECLFAEYLVAHHLTDWDHEKAIPGRATTPDFNLRFDGTSHFFEVKEFDAITLIDDDEGGPTDPYAPLREKVNQASRQFKHYKEFSCSLVLADPNGAFVNIDSPEIVIGTMLGDIAFKVPLEDPNAPAKRIFTKGGKMINQQRPQNTTINGLVCLMPYRVREGRIEIALDRHDKRMRHRLDLEQVPAFMKSVRSRKTEVLRVIVFENPYARIPLDRRLFRGRWDERWGRQGNRIRRLYAGSSLRRIEQELAKCDRRSPLQRHIDRSQPR